MKIKVDLLLEKFISETESAFRFLETDYGYKQVGLHIESEKYYPESEASVWYLGHQVAIKIFWYFASEVIGVVLIELKKNDQIPEKVDYYGNSPELPQAITLYSLVAMLTKNRQELFLLGDPSSPKLADIKKREKKISNSMEKVINNLSQILLEFGLPIVGGDTSIFPNVQKYEHQLKKN
jgi:hypothetical protein